MNEDIYARLGERLNQNPYRLPLNEPVLALLRHLFTEEQAALGAEFPLGAHTADSLAGELNRDQGQLTGLLEIMADKGLIFTNRQDDGTIDYSLNPFAPGIIELQFMRGNETEEERRTAQLLKAVHASVAELVRPLYQDPEKANEVFPRPGLRTLSIEETLPDGTTIYPYEQITSLLEGEMSYAAGACTCRQEHKLNNDACKIENAPKNTCIYFGKVADYMVDWNFADRLTKGEVLDLLKACEDAGLVHNATNTWGNSILMCNCCSCCCPFLRNMKTFRGLQSVAKSNFVAIADRDSCIGCGECIDRCQMEALSLVDDAVSLHQDYCIGCANCTSVCPTESLSMVRQSENQPPIRKSKVEKLGK
ncbi:MAG: 4Fe-4S dicluster-binding protein [Desulfobacterales bacterium]